MHFAYQAGQLKKLLAGHLTWDEKRLPRTDILLRLESLQIVLALEEASGLQSTVEEPLYDTPRSLLWVGDDAAARKGRRRRNSSNSQQALDSFSLRWDENRLLAIVCSSTAHHSMS
jgi:hypothetical protein